MINIADNPAVLQQLAAASKVVESPALVNQDSDQRSDEAGGRPAYPSKDLELIDGRYQVTEIKK